MNDTNTRTFTVERSNGHTPFKFAVRILEDGAIQVTRISPYDATEYHWALKSAGRNFWNIFRKGHKVSTVAAYIGNKLDKQAEPFTPEQIAYFLIEADMKAHLKPLICRD